MFKPNATRYGEAMSESEPGQRREISSARVLTAHEPSANDIERAQRLPADACPRCYCWWWQTLSFDWETPVTQGCRFMHVKKHPTYEHPHEPCVRCVQTSTYDHFEPREPHLLEDGLDGVNWLRQCHNFNGTQLSEEWLDFMASWRQRLDQERNGGNPQHGDAR